MKNFIKFTAIFLTISLFGCSKEDTRTIKESGNAILIAYEVNTPSRIWIKESLHKDVIHEVYTSTEKREPFIKLVDTINVVYIKKISNKKIVGYKINTYLFNKIPSDTINKIVSMEKYYRIYKKY